MTMASRIGVMRDGELLQVGTPREIYENPSSRYVAGRLGTPQINFLPALGCAFLASSAAAVMIWPDWQ